MAQDWNKVIEDSRTEIESLEIKREAINKRIAHLKQAILVAQSLAKDSDTYSALTVEIDVVGITDSCREVLKASDKWMSPLAVRSALESKGLDLSKQRNAMASIHTVLKRLKAQGDAVSGTASDGGTIYKWRKSLFKARRFSSPPPEYKGASLAGPVPCRSYPSRDSGHASRN